MNTLEFLQRVLPSTGLYVTTVINKDEAPRQRFYSSVEEVSNAVLKLDAHGCNTYYAISAFREKGSRKQDNVRATRVLALDVDCGPSKPYPSQQDGIVALDSFISVTGLPKPMIVSSGNGLHVYWPLTEELPPEQWHPLAEALKLATVQYDFRVDAKPTANSALVLRPIGTHNPKNNARVRLLLDKGPYPYADLAAVLHPAIAVPVPAHIRKAFADSKLAQALAVTNDYPPATATIVASKCKQIQWAIAHPAEVEEPIWYAMMGVAGSCTDPDATAVEWSVGHPKFNATAAVAKMKQWVKTTTGPATCKRFEDERPSGCKECKFKGKVITPAQLGVQFQEITVASDVPILAITDVPLPKPFKRTTNGIKQSIDGVDIDVLSFDLYPVSYGTSNFNRHEDVRFCFNRSNVGWQELTLRNAHLMPGNERDFSTALGNQGIRLSSKSQIERVQHMLRSYMDKLCELRGMTNLQTSMGWRDNNLKFAIGNTLYSRNDDGTVSEQETMFTTHAAEMGTDLYSVKGSLKKMVDFTAIMDKLGMHAQMFTLCVSLSAPLYKFTGMNGQTVSLFGKTGCGKSLGQLWAQSLWGNPELLHLTARHTTNALYKRMGTTCNLPITIDEFTTRDKSEVGEFLFFVTQGRDKLRLTRDSEEKPTMHFAMPVIVSTNMSLNEKMFGATTHSDAQLMRLLEVNVIANPYLSKDIRAADSIRRIMTNNYGHIGRAFIKKLLELGPEKIQKAIDKATDEFDEVYGVTFDGAERYWRNTLVLAFLAGKWATKWNLIKFDYEEGIRWVINQLLSIRLTANNSKRDAFDLLTEYLNKNADTAVHEDMTAGRVLVNCNNNARGAIRVRYQRRRDRPAVPFTQGTVYIDSKDFRTWVNVQGCDYSTTMDTLKENNLVITAGRDTKMYLGKGTANNPGQIRVIGIDLGHDRLRGILDPTVSDDDAPPDRRLRIV